MSLIVDSLKLWIKKCLKSLGLEITIIRKNSILRNYTYRMQSLSDVEVIRIAVSQKDNDSIVIIGAYDLLSFDCIADMLFGSEKKIFLFEPREKPFNILLSNIEKLNLKNCKCLNLAVHPSLQNLKIYEVEESKVYKYESWISGMASLYKERLLEHAEDSDLKFSQVNCSSPDNWYQDFDIAQISYLQIDTEGFDYEILKSINLAFHTPSVIRLEFVNLGKEDQEYVLQYLTDFGYDLMFNGEDLIAVNLRKLI